MKAPPGLQIRFVPAILGFGGRLSLKKEAESPEENRYYRGRALGWAAENASRH
jgi:hypothetical protein